MPQLVCRVRGNVIMFPLEKKVIINKTIQVYTPVHNRKREGLLINLYGYRGKWNWMWSERRRLELMDVRKNRPALVSKAINMIETNGLTQNSIK